MEDDKTKKNSSSKTYSSISNVVAELSAIEEYRQAHVRGECSKSFLAAFMDCFVVRSDCTKSK